MSEWHRDNPCHLGAPQRFRVENKISTAHRWADWLPCPCCLKGPQPFRVADKIRTSPQVGGLAASPLLSGGPKRFATWNIIASGPQVGRLATSSPPSGPSVSEQRTKSQVAHNWAGWLHHPCSLGGLKRFRAGDKIRSGQIGWHIPYRLWGLQRFKEGNKTESCVQVGRLATSPLPSWGSPTLHRGELNQNWPTSGWIGYLTLPSRGPMRQRGGQNQKWPTSGEVAKSPLPSRGSQMLHRGGLNWKWPTNGRIGYINFPLAVLGGSPTLHSGGQNQKQPTTGHIGDGTDALWRVPNVSQRGTESEVAHKWADWQHHWCSLVGLQRFREVGEF